MNLILTVGPPGVGKSTLAKDFINAGYTYINQDTQGAEHLELFKDALEKGQSVIVDRMGFSKAQRSRYLDLAKLKGYKTKIVVLHQPYSVCLDRCLNRKDHPTIKDEKSARSALNTFFTKYERVEDSEADGVERIWPEGEKPLAIVSDLDGTLCQIDHRLHFIRGEGKKDWKSFFEHLSEDTLNEWCAKIVQHMGLVYQVVYCSGRPDNYRRQTEDWLDKHNLREFRFGDFHVIKNPLYMRSRGDYRPDSVVKEILLDFEILTRYRPLFFIDDRGSIIELWRRRGFVALQCSQGDF